MSRLFALVVLMVGFLTESSGWAMTSTVKPYDVWKSEKITQAQMQVNTTKQQLILQGQRNDKNKDQALRVLYNQLNQDEWNLEIAKDLAVTDYIVLYLSEQKSETRHLEAAARLSIQEVADIIEAYSKTVGVLQKDKATVPTLRNAGQDD